jgi:hypothetical protein
MRGEFGRSIRADVPVSRRRRCCAGTRELVARRWTYPHTSSGARSLDEQVVYLGLRLVRENRSWAT